MDRRNLQDPGKQGKRSVGFPNTIPFIMKICGQILCDYVQSIRFSLLYAIWSDSTCFIQNARFV